MTDEGMDQAKGMSGGVGAPADLGPRILARLIDSILLWFVFSIVVIPLFIMLSLFGSYGSMFGFGFGGFLYAIITTALVVGYYTLMEAQMGQTVGKMVMGLRTEGPDGKNPTMEEAAKRNAWYVLGIIPLLGWLLELGAVIYIMITINQSPEREGWHDQFAGGTRVVKTK
jgi:uncharacterized RDD family membrane protein YckC